MIATKNLLLVSFQVFKDSETSFRVVGHFDEGMVSDGMFATFQHNKVFTDSDSATRFLERIQAVTHYCRRHGSNGCLVNDQHWARR